MSTFVSLVINGKPVAKARPRAVRIGTQVRMYTPRNTASYESQVARTAKYAMNGHSPTTNPVGVRMEIKLPVPKSWSNPRRRAALDGLEIPSGKPDIDNVIKAVFDGLNGIVWKDDAQVAEIEVSKQYSLNPRVFVEVMEFKCKLSAEEVREIR